MRDSSLTLRMTDRWNVGTGRALSEEFLTTDFSDYKDFNLCESVQSVVCNIFGRANPAPTAYNSPHLGGVRGGSAAVKNSQPFAEKYK